MKDKSKHQLLVEYIQFYEKNMHKEVQEDKARLDLSNDIIIEFITMYNESLVHNQQERAIWLFFTYGAENNFKLLIEWIHHSLSTSDSISKLDNLAQSQENIFEFLLEQGHLQIHDIQQFIIVLKRREIIGYPDRARKLLEFHLKKIGNELENSYSGQKLNNQNSITITIEQEIRNHFSFMSSEDHRTHKYILSDSDFDRFISWTTYFFSKDFLIPKISSPIKNVNTAKGNVVYAFIEFFKFKYPASTRPDSLFEFIKACFYPYREDNIINLKKTRRPQYYKHL